jgi:sulfur carrier protein ThiS
MTSTLIIHNGGKLVERAISSDLSPVTLQEYLDNYDIPPGELRLWHNGDQVPHDTTPRSTRRPIRVEVIDLVIEPMCHRSSGATGEYCAALR